MPALHLGGGRRKPKASYKTTIPPALYRVAILAVGPGLLRIISSFPPTSTTAAVRYLCPFNAIELYKVSDFFPFSKKNKGSASFLTTYSSKIFNLTHCALCFCKIFYYLCSEQRVSAQTYLFKGNGALIFFIFTPASAHPTVSAFTLFITLSYPGQVI